MLAFALLMSATAQSVQANQLPGTGGIWHLMALRGIGFIEIVSDPPISGRSAAVSAKI